MVIGDGAGAAWVRAMLTAPDGATIIGPALSGGRGATVQEPKHDEEPIRLKFGGSGPKPKQMVTKQDVVDLKADQQVSSLDGRAYDGNRQTGQLRLQGGSDRVHRRAQGLSGRQWKKLRKAARRSSAPVDDLGNPEPQDLGERDLGEHGNG